MANSKTTEAEAAEMLDDAVMLLQQAVSRSN